MYALLVQRADELMGCTENSPEERELDALADVIEAYEALGYRQSLFRRRQRVISAVRRLAASGLTAGQLSLC
jgi:hypothetical protein